MTGTSVASDVRIGTADRERAAALLGEHFSAGRLDTDEFDQRVRAAYAARIGADLAVLFRDLPGPQSLQPRPRRTAWIDRRLLLLALLVVASVAWVAMVHLPPFFLFFVAWIVLGRGRRRHYRLVGPNRRW